MAGRARLGLPFSRHRLRELRERQGLSQDDLAQLCTKNGHPMDRTIISRIERGTFGPTPKALHAIVKALGVKLDDLLDEEQNVCDCVHRLPRVIYDKHEAAYMLRVGVAVLEKKAARREIPFTWRGRAYGFTLQQIKEIADAWGVRSIRELPSPAGKKRTPAKTSGRGRRRAPSAT